MQPGTKAGVVSNVKTKFLPLILAAACATSAFAQSKRTAEYILSNPAAYEGKAVTLDVSMVKPVHWKSPLPEFQFFHALTLDRQARQPGGAILVAIPASESSSFAKKYGMNFEGRHNSTTLRGTLVAAARPGPRHLRIFLVDTTGNLLTSIEKAKAELPEEAFADSGEAMFPGMGHPGLRKRGM